MSQFPPIRSSEPERVGRRRKRLAGAVFVGVLAVAGGVVALQQREAVAAGPLVVGGNSTANAQPIDAHVPFSFGYMLWNEGKKPAAVERVRVVGITGPIEVVDVLARQHPSGPRHQTFMAAFGFPPPDFPARPLAEEHTVLVPKTFNPSGSPYDGLQLVVGVRSTGPGIGRIRGIEVTYTVDGQRYRNASNGRGFLCAPAAEYVHGAPKADTCPGPLDDVVWAKKYIDFRVPAEDRQ